MHARTAEEANSCREQMICAIERDAARFRESGLTQQWLQGAPGVLPEESSELEIGYTYNDLDSVKAALEAADGDCAAIFVGGASYPYSAATEMPTPTVSAHTWKASTHAPVKMPKTASIAE